ncbi:hypothetical protein LTR66_007502 [Elasticomyces elasticus]|nr:hypothetical protein LTR66_007502 [Elasticomyces elasticus]
MSSDERSPKRLRGSYSPASPPYHLTKLDQHTKQFLQSPQTPPSPPRMSSMYHVSSEHTDSHTFPSPPASGRASSRTQWQRNELRVKENLPGAADSQDNVSAPMQDNDGDAQMQDQLSDVNVEDAATANAATHMHTNHDRELGTFQASSSNIDDSSRQNADMRPLYKLCETLHPISQPHPSQNLMSLYGLDKLATSVARNDPVTGEKINKLRKSYEGKAKNLGLAGKNKATDIKGELMGFFQWDDNSWYDQKVWGKELDKALTSSKLMAKLDKAVKMAPGKLPAAEEQRFKNMLGLDDIAAAKTPNLPPTKSAFQHAISKSTGRASAPASPRTLSGRPERTGTKRKYDESSYQGYQGYPDGGGGGRDDQEMRSADDGRRGSATKKRRKDVGSVTSPRFDRPGMIGISTS